MAKFHIKPDSLKVMGGEKLGMEVKFIAEGGQESEFMYHEVEGVTKEALEEQLQMTADEWEKGLAVESPAIPNVETGKDISVELIQP